jgi:hypothetical protein
MPAQRQAVLHGSTLAVTSREVVGVFLKQLWLTFVPVFHGLQGRCCMDQVRRGTRPTRDGSQAVRSELFMLHATTSSGAILLLFVPQVLKEVDSKKRDGRLAKHAREFNRLIAPAAETGGVVRLVDGPPFVDLALAVTNRIDWDQLDDLDPDEPDARVVAQVLNEKHTDFDLRV